MTHFFNPEAQVHWQWVSMSGPDAKDFLHRVTTVNLKTLRAGTGADGCLLTAMGKIRALFTLWSCAPDEYGFELEAGASGRWKQELLAAIDQVHFAEKFMLSEPTAFAARWIFPSEGLLGLPQLGTNETKLSGDIRFCHHGSSRFGRPWITIWGESPKLDDWIRASGAEEVSLSLIEKWRIEALQPRIDAEISENTIPLEVGLIDALAMNKGCYPGQEVIERTISIGSPARRLVQLEGTGETPAAGSSLKSAADLSTEVGTVTSVARADGDRFIALGLIRKTHAKEGMEVRFESGAQAKLVRIAPFSPAPSH